MSKAKRRAQAQRRAAFATFCVGCGHRAADHEDGFIGAMDGIDHLCHVDDHSCYMGREATKWVRLGLLTEAGLMTDALINASP